MGRRRAFLLLSSVIAITVAVAACLSGSTRRERTARRRLADGDRRGSPERRTAAERPRPWQEEKPPHAADRTGVEPYRADKQAEALAPRVKEAPAVQRCLRLMESYPCPLLAHRWQAKEIPGGVKLEVEASRKKAARLHAALRCLTERVFRHDRDAGCLARFRPARITGGYHQKRMWLELKTRDTAAVAGLRKKVMALVGEAL